MTYLPIEDYGIIGDMHTAALVGKNGAIDWFCYPRFDSPSIFAAILDDEKGGRFQITLTDDDYNQQQFYWPDTNVLVTRFLSEDGIGEVTDYMPTRDRTNHHKHETKLIRQVRVIHGTLTFKMVCQPAFNYARDKHETKITADGAAFHTPGLSIGVSSSVALHPEQNGVVAEFTLSEDEVATFTLQECEPGGGCKVALTPEEAEGSFNRTVAYWRNWLSQCTYKGRWREVVYRSALALKLLTYEPTGAIVAAPTCSLPEGIGGERNWDYRYTWIRDAAFTLYALLRIGFHEEAAAFMNWLGAIVEHTELPLQPVYGIDGRAALVEEHLDHLEGYKGSQPVRIGNGAYEQFQLDIYGALMDSVYLYNKYGSFISYEQWMELKVLVDWVCENWNQKDDGIWEVRGGQQNFVYSRVMCWLAIDRAMRIADKRSFPMDRTHWRTTRDAIYSEVMEKGWSEERQAFVQHYDNDTLDASNLLMPLTYFVAPTDPRAVNTVNAIRQSTKDRGLVSGGLVFRYLTEETNDGLEGEEGTFNICTFWLIEALTRAGQVEDARLLFERMLTYTNHLGLYAEETGTSGEALGNFPQAFTHLALISAIFNLDRAMGSS